MELKKIFALTTVSLILIMTLSSDNLNRAFTEGQNSSVEDQNSSPAGQEFTAAGLKLSAEGLKASATEQLNSFATGCLNDSATEGSNSSAAPEQIKEAVEFRDLLFRYVNGQDGKYGIYYKSTGTGIEFGINSSDAFDAASTVKVPMNLYIIKQYEEGTLSPDQKYKYLEKDYSAGTGIMAGKKFGTEFKIRELCKHSIEVSDNVATNILLRNIGRPVLKEYMRKIGGEVIDPVENITCPKDMALYLGEVLKLYESGNPYGAELMGYLLNTVFNDRIPKLLPPTVKIAHKIGSQVRAYHDVGIVFTDKPFILAVMSENVDMNISINIIAEISKKAYDFTIN